MRTWGQVGAQALHVSRNPAASAPITAETEVSAVFPRFRFDLAVRVRDLLDAGHGVGDGHGRVLRWGWRGRMIRPFEPLLTEILLKQKSFPRGNVFKPRGVNMCSWSESPQTKAGGSNGRLDDQDCDAGNVFDCVDRCAIIHSSFCDGRRWWRRWWWRRSPCFLAAS